MKINVYMSESTSYFDPTPAFKQAINAHINRQRIPMYADSTAQDRLASLMLNALPKAAETIGSKLCILETGDGAVFDFKVIVVKGSEILYDMAEKFRRTKTFNSNQPVVYNKISGGRDLYYPFISYDYETIMKYLTE